MPDAITADARVILRLTDAQDSEMKRASGAETRPYMHHGKIVYRGHESQSS